MKDTGNETGDASGTGCEQKRKPDVHSSGHAGNENRTSSYFVENGSYAKLRQVQLGYNLPKSVIEKLRMTNLRFYVSGQNLLTLKSSSLTCSDPENPRWMYPNNTSFTLGLQASF